jgi:hypothetical protein
MYEQLLKEATAADLMSADVRGEIAAGQAGAAQTADREQPR